MYAVGFTGTQEGWTEKQRIAVTALFTALFHNYTWLHEGDCIGADAEANKVWRELGGKIYQHPPIITTKRAFSPYDLTSEPDEYLKRNRHIVNSSDIMVATPKGPEVTRSGTWSTVRYARSKEIIPIFIVFPDGSVKKENI